MNYKNLFIYIYFILQFSELEEKSKLQPKSYITWIIIGLSKYTYNYYILKVNDTL